MPTLDRRLLSWGDSDTDDDDGKQGHTTSSSWSLAVDDDRCSAPAFVDDVLVPREVANNGRGVTEADRPAFLGTRKVRTT
jgi:hypothetical protein